MAELVHLRVPAPLSLEPRWRKIQYTFTIVHHSGRTDKGELVLFPIVTNPNLPVAAGEMFRPLVEGAAPTSVASLKVS
jgi:hypothetical protein